MYTRCPSCNSTFRVTAAVLQMAGGDVRCGSCGVVFNALQTLVDDWSGNDFTLPGTPRLTHPDEPAPAAGMEPEPGDAGPAPPEALEFNVPENEWQRYFITPAESAAPAPRPEPGLGADFAAAVPDDEAAPDAADDVFEDAGPAPGRARSLEEETADTDTWQAFLREAEGPGDDEEDDEPLFVVGDDAPGPAPESAAALPSGPDDDWEGQEEDEIPADAEPEAGDEVEIVIDEVLVEAEPTAPPARRPAADTVLDWGPAPAFPEPALRPPAHTGRWLAASVVAALALAGQVVHYHRDELAADPGYGALVREAYARLGLPLDPGWPLDSYEIRGAKAIAENTAPGALDIVAEIAVTGPQSVGLPMVRVVLRDRWSNPVGSGTFAAADYLAEAPPPAGVYPPGSLIPVQISLKDPGTTAQGYELDVCVPDRKLGLQCKTARDPFRR